MTLSDGAALQAQKDLSLIEKSDEGERQQETHYGHEQVSRAFGDRSLQKEAQVAPCQSQGQLSETSQHIAGEIDRDRVHPHPDKGLAPCPELDDVHNVIEQRHQKGAVTRRNQNVGRGPNLFDHWKVDVPDPPKGNCGCAPPGQNPYFPHIRRGTALKKEACQHSQEAGGDGWDRAQDSFWIVELVVFAGRQIVEVKVVDGIQPRLKFTLGPIGRYGIEAFGGSPGESIFYTGGVTGIAQCGGPFRVSGLFSKSGQIPFFQLDVADGNEGNHRPIPNEEAHAPGRECLRLEEAEDDAWLTGSTGETCWTGAA